MKRQVRKYVYDSEIMVYKGDKGELSTVYWKNMRRQKGSIDNSDGKLEHI